MLVKTTGGGDLPSDTVTSIVHLVASSIPNMNPDDVTVADANGKVLHAPGMDLGAGSGAQLEAKQTYDAASRRGRSSDMIAATLGPGHAAVTVERQPRHVEVGLDRRELHEPGRWQQDAPAQAEQRSNDVDRTRRAVRRTVSSAWATTATPTTAANTNRNYSETKNAQDNAVNSNTVQSQTPPGQLKPLSVSVLLDSAVVKPTDVAQWTSQIQAAAGIDPKRDGANALQGDDRRLRHQTAIEAAQTPAGGSSSGSNPIFDLLKHRAHAADDRAGAVLRLAGDQAGRGQPGAAASAARPARARSRRHARSMRSRSARRARLAAAERAAARTAADRDVEGEITDLIERQPDEVAQTLRSWLADRRT